MPIENSSVNGNMNDQRLRERAETAEKELERSRQEADDLKLEKALYSAAKRAGFREPGMGVTLAKQHTKWDREAKRAVALDRVRSIDDVMKSVTFGNEYLLKPDSGQEGQKPLSSEEADIARAKYIMSNGVAANKLAKEDIAEYRRLKAVARRHGIIKF